MRRARTMFPLTMSGGGGRAAGGGDSETEVGGGGARAFVHAYEEDNGPLEAFALMDRRDGHDGTLPRAARRLHTPQHDPEKGTEQERGTGEGCVCVKGGGGGRGAIVIAEGGDAPAQGTE